MGLLGKDWRGMRTDAGHEVVVFPNGDGKFWVWLCSTCEHTGYGACEERIHRAAMRHVEGFQRP